MSSFDHINDSNAWALVVAAWLCIMILIGGVSTPANWAILLHSIASGGLLVAAIWRLRHGFPSKISAFGAVVLTSALALVLLQLLPLPFSVWSTLPGRQLVADTFSIVGVAPASQPLSLSASSTKASAIALLPALAGYFAMLTVGPRGYTKVAIAILACAVLGLVIGLAQKSMGDGSGLYFYGNLGPRVASGTFGNRNFFAAQLFTSIPFVAALATMMSHSRRARSAVVLVFAFIYMALLVAGLAVTGSRGGIILAIVSVLLSVLFVYRHPVSAARGVSNRWSFYAVMACFVLIVQVGMVGITRLVQTDVIQDYRNEIYAVTWKAAQAYFPAGSGFGSFVPVYQQFETPSVIIANYVNHAHNDWLEILLEGGAPALVLLVAFILLFLTSAFFVGRLASTVAHHAFHRAALVVLFLMLAHAMVDFALRTPALMSIFAVCCGIVVASRSRNQKTFYQDKPVPASGHVTPSAPTGDPERTALQKKWLRNS